MHRIVFTTGQELIFSGRHLPDRETKNWHIYETNDGFIHVRKEHMVAVIESNSDACKFTMKGPNT